jgi:hypothetical protein
MFMFDLAFSYLKYQILASCIKYDFVPKIDVCWQSDQSAGGLADGADAT